MQLDDVISVELTLAEWNHLVALADPAFRTVALITKIRQQALAQTGAAPPAMAGNGSTERLDVSD